MGFLGQRPCSFFLYLSLPLSLPVSVGQCSHGLPQAFPIPTVQHSALVRGRPSPISQLSPRTWVQHVARRWSVGRQNITYRFFLNIRPPAYKTMVLYTEKNPVYKTMVFYSTIFLEFVFNSSRLLDHGNERYIRHLLARGKKANL